MNKMIIILASLFPLICLVFSNEVVKEELLSSSPEEYDQEDVGKDMLTHSSVYFLESFNDKSSLRKSWIISKAKKKTDDGTTLQFDGDWVLDKPLKDPLPNDLGLTFNDKAKHRAIAAKLFRDFTFSNRPFVIQYEVLHQDGQECGGAYLKLLSKGNQLNLNEFSDKTPYTIMFGPDKCGTSNKLHFIFRHQNPLNSTFEEKHCKQSKTRIDETFTDSKPHLFKLVVNPDNTFSISLDHKVINEGSLLEDFEPAVNPPREIDDPNDKKPQDWDDRAKIPDPSAKKPDDWDDDAPPEIIDANAVKPADWLEDEPINISDPSAEKPDDWDEEMDGEWEAPLVPNPACEEAPGCGPWSPPLIRNPDYKGKWTPPLIDNPNFKGVWKPRKIPNPDFFEDINPYRMTPIGAVGFEIWSISARILFDNIIITDDENVAKQFASITFDKKILKIEKNADTLWSRVMIAINHKPGWWSLYFLYCLFPVAIYAWYLWRRVKEDTLFNQFVAFTNRYPWLWALYVVILLIPVTLIVVCCFWSNKESDGDKKKNDDLGLDNSLLGESSYSSISSDQGKETKKRLSDSDDEQTNGLDNDHRSHSREPSQSNCMEDGSSNNDDNEEQENSANSEKLKSTKKKEPDAKAEGNDESESGDERSPIEPVEPENVLKKRK